MGFFVTDGNKSLIAVRAGLRFGCVIVVVFTEYSCR